MDHLAPFQVVIWLYVQFQTESIAHPRHWWLPWLKWIEIGSIKLEKTNYQCLDQPGRSCSNSHTLDWVQPDMLQLPHLFGDGWRPNRHLMVETILVHPHAVKAPECARLHLSINHSKITLIVKNLTTKHSKTFWLLLETTRSSFAWPMWKRSSTVRLEYKDRNFCSTPNWAPDMLKK